MSTILVVDDIKAVRDQYAYDIHRKTGYEVLTAANGDQVLNSLDEYDIDVIILDLEMPVMGGIETLEAIKEKGYDNIPVVVYTAKGNFQSCVNAVRLGAYNFFDKNEINMDHLIRTIENAIEHRRLLLENQRLKQTAVGNSSIISNSPAMASLKKLVEKVALVPSNVLIFGESGTGKEVVAKEIHRLSPRSGKPFVALNCAALPENLVESELFGFEKGAFSGAIRTTRGKFEIADGGTLFLDEIGDMPLSVQAKLLRVLQENEITRIGGEGKLIKVDTRVIAATNRDLEEEIKDGRFRQDLYFRIATHIINVPPLRERREDIEPLVRYFIRNTCERFGLSTKQINMAALGQLKSYGWNRNNVRELENIVERMIIQCEGENIKPEHIPLEIRDHNTLPDMQPGKTFAELKQEAEKKILLTYLEAADWHITNTAKTLGIANHSNLLKMMRRLDIRRPPK